MPTIAVTLTVLPMIPGARPTLRALRPARIAPTTIAMQTNMPNGWI
jgi:hypothetical protein